MKASHIFIAFISMPLMMMSGCSFMNNNDSRPSNIAPAVAPQVAAEGASARKKPRQPQPEPVQQLQEQEIMIEQVEESPVVCEMTTYIVKKGDTIYGLARKFHVRPIEIMHANELDKDSKLQIGQSLSIPCSECNATANIPTKEPSGKEYIVVSGDSLYKISRKYGISIKELRDNNNLSSDTLYVGQKLMLPSNARETITPSSAATTTLDSNGTYTVVRGDSIYVIAKRFGVSQADIMRVNNISSPERLQIGQKLTIPTKDTIAKSTTKPVIQNAQKPIVHDTGTINTPSPIQENKKIIVPEKPVVQESPAMTPVQVQHQEITTDDFFDNFEEIPVVEINN